MQKNIAPRQNQPMLSLVDLQYACRQAAIWQGNARVYSEKYFEVFTASFNGSRGSFFTGYYEPELKASLTQKPGFNEPVYAVPDDLITVNLSNFDKGW